MSHPTHVGHIRWTPILRNFEHSPCFGMSWPYQVVRATQHRKYKSMPLLHPDPLYGNICIKHCCLLHGIHHWPDRNPGRSNGLEKVSTFHCLCSSYTSTSHYSLTYNSVLDIGLTVTRLGALSCNNVNKKEDSKLLPKFADALAICYISTGPSFEDSPNVL